MIIQEYITPWIRILQKIFGKFYGRILKMKELLSYGNIETSWQVKLCIFYIISWNNCFRCFQFASEIVFWTREIT
jgi:hypothetical protein